ncbi:MAG: AMP-binding protein [Deltaproteobacteria bacterium]|nr:AMP-binding protein [Deltaproteobacteria bacterium]
MEIVRRTIGEMFDATVKRYPEKDALVHTAIGIRYPYSLFAWEVERAAKGLIRLGVAKGDRVALWAPNIPEWLIAQMAVYKAGAVLVPIDPGVEGEDLEYYLSQSGTRVLIMARGLENTEYVDLFEEVRDRVPGIEHVIVAATQAFPGTIPWTDLTAMGEGVSSQTLAEREKGIVPEDPVAVMYTSGTTGRPKGVVLDHLGLINKSLASTRRQGLSHRDRLCFFFPAYHMFGNTCIALSGFLVGAALVMPCLAFDVHRILEAIYRERCTAVYGSPSMFIALLDSPEFKKKRWTTVKKGTLGGSPCPIDLMRRLVQEVGVEDITVGYGITEASSWITMTLPGDPLERRVSTIGLPLECNEVKIIDFETGETLAPGNQGELCVRGLLMKGYYEMPAATAAAIDRDGWFHTGDLGVMDEGGYVRITGRLNDVILREGEEIHPSELEEMIYGLPEVSEVQVFGFPYPGRGQEVAAWVKLKKGENISIEAFSREVLQRVPLEKAPRFFKFVSSFPMTRTGKVQKFKLSEMAQEEYL